MDKTRQQFEKERHSSKVSVNCKTGNVVNDGKYNIQNSEQNESRNGNRRKGFSKQEDKRVIRQQKIDQKRKVQFLHLKVENFDGNEDKLKGVLGKITRSGFTLRNFELENRNAFCIAEFPSARQVKDALYSFQTYNKTSSAKIVAKKDEFTRQLSPETKLLQYLDKIAEEAEIVLLKHQEQISSLQERINRTDRTSVTADVYTRKNEETKALKLKLQEMDLQKKEFKRFLKCTDERLKSVSTTNRIDTALKEIYTAFHVECIRLKNALPMYAYRTEIISMVTKNQVSILLGETGSGKSTQVAQYMYQAGMANNGMIVCTQPRKIAAISLATHVSKEMCTSVGHLVGYKVGMQIKKSHETKIIYMTDHMLLNECLQDKDFLAYSCIIIDEAHERSIYTDLLLGMVKKCMKKRPDLRVVVTSATIDPSVFVSYFGGNCPVLSVAGRMFPVDVEWLDDDSAYENYEQSALEKTIHIHRTEENGDILTFLTSPLEVERCCTAFQEVLESETNFVCLPLHGRLQANEQQKVFDPLPKGKRKVVFATNSAETSITIPGIKFVVDTGVAKEMQFDPKKNISTLCVTTVTKSSADQRKGRAGRTEEGKCFRLYSSQVYDEMKRNSRPEILRVHLGHALLKLMELGVAPLEFDFVQAPPRELMDAAMESLESIGAAANRLITKLGKWIAKLPIDPTFGAFIYKAIKEGVGIESMILSACCATSGSIFYRSGTDEEKSKADKLKVRFCHEGGDLMTMLNVYREWHVQSEKLKGKWCAENAINGKAIKGVRETVNEILNVLKNEQATKLKFKLSSPTEIDIKLQKMLFRTFSRNICHFIGHEKAGYLVVQKDQQVQLFPASSLKSLGIQPDWLVIEQVLKTSRDFAINVTTVPNEWITEACSEGWLQLDLENISRQRIEQAALFEVGDQVYKDFVGIRHSELKKLEEVLKINNKNKMVILEASKQYGEISLYSQHTREIGIANSIRERITSIRQKMKQETSEQFLSYSNTGVRVVMGSGLNVVDVLMAEEYKTIFVSGIPKFIETKTEEDMLNTFEKFGKIVKMEKFRNSKNKNNWGRITFQKKEDAEQAVRMMKGNIDVNARPSIGVRSGDVHLFRTKLQWPRRPSRGFGFVRFANPSDAVRSYTFPISVGGTVVNIKPSKSHMSEVHVGNLNPHVDEDVLRQGFEDALGLIPSDIERVTVIRQKVHTTPDMLQTFRQRINRKLQEYIEEGTYEFDLRSPKDQDFTYLAFVSFSKPDEGLAACAGIDHSFVLNGEVVTMKADLKSSVMIPKLVYEKYKSEVDTLVETLSKTKQAHIRQKEIRNENVVVEVHTDSIETMIKVKNYILSAIKGSVIDVETNIDINRLFTWDGKKIIKVVMEKTDTTIVTDERLLSVSIHGSERNKQRAIEMLAEYLNELKTGKSTRYFLKGADKPPGVMKELMLRYEFDLNKLKMETGLKCVELDHRFHVVTVLGDTQSTENCCSIIEKVVEYVIKKRKQCIVEPTLSRDCVVCLCPIEEGELYRLEVCGHAYCKECVELQFKSDTKSNTFPLTCSSDGCSELWSWKDITTLSVKSGVPIAVLVKKSTNLFVLQNKKFYRYCPTADCPLIYRISDKEKLFCCSECEVRICTACHNQFHEGLTCKMVESMKKDDGGLKLWMSQNADKAKYCPKCKTPIEKVAGCNHMTCIGCKANICWVCLSYFSSESDCYGHMRQFHGSFV